MYLAIYLQRGSVISNQFVRYGKNKKGDIKP